MVRSTRQGRSHLQVLNPKFYLLYSFRLSILSETHIMNFFEDFCLWKTGYLSKEFYNHKSDVQEGQRQDEVFALKS
jgi:hypothetical protein